MTYECVDCKEQIPDDKVCGCFTVKEEISLDEIREHFYQVSKRQGGKEGCPWLQCGQIIDKCKQALIRGMQKPLRFKKSTISGYGGPVTVYLLMTTRDKAVMRQAFPEKKDARKFASDLDLPCEFIED